MLLISFCMFYFNVCQKNITHETCSFVAVSLGWVQGEVGPQAPAPAGLSPASGSACPSTPAQNLEPEV